MKRKYPEGWRKCSLCEEIDQDGIFVKNQYLCWTCFSQKVEQVKDICKETDPFLADMIQEIRQIVAERYGP